MKTLECNKPYINNMEVNKIKRQYMKEIKKDVNYGDRTVRVILQFPDESEDAAMIRDSVKSILTMELEKQLKTIM